MIMLVKNMKWYALLLGSITVTSRNQSVKILPIQMPNTRALNTLGL